MNHNNRIFRGDFLKLSDKEKKMLQGAVAPTIVATLIFLITYFFFGMENTMIGPFATLSFLRCRNMCNHYECLIRNFSVYMIMAVLSFLAVLNLPLCIIVNAIALFWIACLLIDEYNPNNYFPAGMALISDGFDVCKELLTQTGCITADSHSAQNETSEQVPKLHKKLCAINQHISREIYSANRATLRLKGKTNWYCRFVLVFQIINYLTDHAQEDNNQQTARSIYEKFYAQFQKIEPATDYRRLNFRIRKPDIRNLRFRFALRQVFVLTPCLVLAYLWQTDNIYWLVISVFFMMIPFTEYTMQRVRQRVFGTMAGIVLSFILFTIFPDFTSRVVIMTVANFLIYAADGYGPTVAFITCSALALQSIDSNIPVVLTQRLIYTLLGGGIALLSNRYVFPIRLQKQMQYLFELLRSLREQLSEIGIRTTPGDDSRRHQIDQLIIKSYLLSTRAEDLQESLPEMQKYSDFEDARKRHMGFLASYLTQYMT